MPAPSTLTAVQLARLIGTHDAPATIDVRNDAEHAADPLRVPGARRRDAACVAAWAAAFAGHEAVVVCADGATSAGVAAWLRHEGVAAETLEGGMMAWRAVGAPTLNPAEVPPVDARGRTVWVTRARPKVDRIACPWLIRRFVDPDAVFLFVAAAEVAATVARFGATPFDIEAVFWSHRGEKCTFDAMVEEFGLSGVAGLARLAVIVRGADTARLDLAPQCAGLLAASLGLSRMYRDDLAQLEAGFSLYDAFWRWSRDAVSEPHDWPSPERAAKAPAEQPA